MCYKSGWFLAAGRHWNFPLCDKHPKTSPGMGCRPSGLGTLPLLALPCTDGALPFPFHRQAGATPPPQCTSSGPGRCRHRFRNPGQKGEERGTAMSHQEEHANAPGTQWREMSSLVWRNRKHLENWWNWGSHKECRDRWAKAPRWAIAGGESANCHLSLILCKRVGWSDCGKP